MYPSIAEAEHAKETAQLLVQERDEALKLAENPIFKKLILDGFMKADCARFVMESGDPCLDAEQRADALAMAQAAGHLKRFLNAKVVMGNTAEKQLAELTPEFFEELRVELARQDEEYNSYE